MKEEIAIELLFQINRLFHDSMRKSGVIDCLSRPQLETIMFIHHNEKVLLKDIADNFKITNASASALIKKLEEKNLVTKKTNEKDKRSAILAISEEGLQKMKQGKKKIAKVLSHLFTNISDQELDNLIKISQKIITNHENI